MQFSMSLAELIRLLTGLRRTCRPCIAAASRPFWCRRKTPRTSTRFAAGAEECHAKPSRAHGRSPEAGAGALGSDAVFKSKRAENGPVRQLTLHPW